MQLYSMNPTGDGTPVDRVIYSEGVRKTAARMLCLLAPLRECFPKKARKERLMLFLLSADARAHP